MRRFFYWLKALFNRMMNRLEDPDVMLDQARRDMQEALRANKEKAVQAITQRNNLQAMVNEHEQKVAQLEQQAVMALKQGNRDLARQFLREKANYAATLESLKVSLAQANETVEMVKLAIRRQEEEVRKKTAEALAMKAQYKQAQIETSINKALEGFTTEAQFGTFEAAAERIREAKSEAAARQELMQSSIQGKVMQMEDQAIDYQAEEELKQLEERLGLSQASQESNPVTETTGDVESELSELEQRLNETERPEG
ncbi:MAG: PspA/IM30 family protein [Armatimonadetes bacterium]|nr:MAG: PspA/IM30 family protein [Armatimonadota bacterium]